MASSSPYRRTRNRQLIRVLRLIRLLETGRRTLPDLSRELSVSERTIRRDLQALEYAGLPTRHVGGEPHGLWSMSVGTDRSEA
jgi:DeoR/GlpR family transcriptional regulator of sugar metabolism